MKAKLLMVGMLSLFSLTASAYSVCDCDANYDIPNCIRYNLVRSFYSDATGALLKSVTIRDFMCSRNAQELCLEAAAQCNASQSS